MLYRGVFQKRGLGGEIIDGPIEGAADILRVAKSK